MRILSIRQPWASSIFRLNKDVENRSWLTSYRGALLIHASLSFDAKYTSSNEFIEYTMLFARRSKLADITTPAHMVQKSSVVRGAIIGVVQLDDIVENSQSLWACEDNYHWLLSHAREFKKPIEGVKGTQGLWRVPEKLKSDVREALDLSGAYGHLPCLVS